MTDNNVEELRDMINNAVSDTSNTAYYNKCDSLSDTRFNWMGNIHLKTMDDWFALPENIRINYAMWYVSMAAINNGIRWQDACNNLVLIQHRLTENGGFGVTSIQYEPSTGDKNVLDSISDNIEKVSSPTMLQLTYIIGSSGFDPSNKKASERLKTMGVLQVPTIEDNAKLDHYENEIITPQALLYAKVIFHIDEKDSDELNGMVYILSNTLKLENDDSIQRFIRLRNAVMKSKQLGLEGDCSYDWLINMANNNRNYLVPIDDKELNENVNKWIERVESI